MTKKYKPNERLDRPVLVRISQRHYRQLEQLRSRSNCRSLSEFLRSMLKKEKIIWYTKDASLQEAASQLAGIRAELNAIGVNINQVTRYFNSSQLPGQKTYTALKVLDEYRKVSDRVVEALQVMSELADQWSQKS